MRQIIWKDEYLTGVEEIDRQHKEFVKLINRLNMIHDLGNNSEYALRLLNEVGKYADYHFTSEENLMALTKYPQLDAQEKAHKDLLIRYRQLIDSYKSQMLILKISLSFSKRGLRVTPSMSTNKLANFWQENKTVGIFQPTCLFPFSLPAGFLLF